MPTAAADAPGTEAGDEAPTGVGEPTDPHLARQPPRHGTLPAQGARAGAVVGRRGSHGAAPAAGGDDTPR
ncbi:hypothetical protein ABZ128_34220, partial [Streptomyces sp. NPDC006326]|uniref:hypothetical protein n=1 Tax=Streptomyces sp. NPDC006326 TaxID=3156752 RepID=UPI0033AEEA52